MVNICERCYHNYVCDEYNADRDFPHKVCAYHNSHFIDAADVVEVVHCKNCRFFSGRQECYCHAADENGTPIFVREDDFCSYGARMDKEDEHEQ